MCAGVRTLSLSRFVQHWPAVDTVSGERTLAGLRANATRRSHAELDEASELDDGDPEELGEEVRMLRLRLPRMNVLGGCCGRDERHVASIARHIAAKPTRAPPA
jgi:S-methylmethionine-dependent homocysteine/selenocysteine methylase